MTSVIIELRVLSRKWTEKVIKNGNWHHREPFQRSLVGILRCSSLSESSPSEGSPNGPLTPRLCSISLFRVRGAADHQGIHASICDVLHKCSRLFLCPDQQSILHHNSSVVTDDSCIKMATWADRVVGMLIFDRGHRC